jgi:hypothetical protein
MLKKKPSACKAPSTNQTKLFLQRRLTQIQCPNAQAVEEEEPRAAQRKQFFFFFINKQKKPKKKPWNTHNTSHHLTNEEGDQGRTDCVPVQRENHQKEKMQRERPWRPTA